MPDPTRSSSTLLIGRSARTPLLALVLLLSPGLGWAGPDAPDPRPAPPIFPVILLQQHAPHCTLEEMKDLVAALGRGMALTHRFELKLAPAELAGSSSADCAARSCLAPTLKLSAAYLLDLSVDVVDKDYTFTLHYTDASAPSRQEESRVSCDICSFDEACRVLEEHAARTSLPDPLQPGELPASTAPRPGVPSGPGSGSLASLPARPAAPPPGPAPQSAVPAPAPRPDPSPVTAPTSPAATARTLAAPTSPTAESRPWPPGWRLRGGSVGHSSRAVGWGLVGAGLTSLLIGSSLLENDSAEGLEQRQSWGLTLDLVGLGTAVVGLVFVFRGDAPPPGSPQEAVAGLAPPAPSGSR